MGIMLTELTKEEIRSLSTHDLAQRMETILERNETERYPAEYFEFDKQFPKASSVIKIFNSQKVQRMTDEKQRTVCYLSFNTLLQIQFSIVASAATNHLVYKPGFTNEHWKSVKTQVNSAALNQFTIISSRISMECFMKLLYFLGEGEEIKSKKSTFKSFKKWLNNPKNPFSYYATHILRAYLFDRNLRTPEVHASSKLHGQVLRMQTPQTFQDRSQPLELANVMMNVWQPLLKILNNETATSMYGSREDFEWLKSYLDSSDEEKAMILQSIFDRMK